MAPKILAAHGRIVTMYRKLRRLRIERKLRVQFGTFEVQDRSRHAGGDVE